MRPWQPLLLHWLDALGVQVMHAAAVAQGERCIVLPGIDGSGKSTTAFACLHAGLSVLGDEAIAVERRGDDWIASAVHTALKLSEGGIARFPGLAADASAYGDERVVHMGEKQTRSAAVVTALAFPSLSDSDETTATRMGSADAARLLLKCCLVAGRSPLAALFESLGDLADSVPAYALEVGRDPGAVAAALELVSAR
jgi:hypothetical protein